MKLLHKLREWLSRRWALVLFFMLILLLWLVPEWLRKPPPSIIHTLGSSTEHANVLWFRQDVSTWLTANASGMVFAMPLT